MTIIRNRIMSITLYDDAEVPLVVNSGPHATLLFIGTAVATRPRFDMIIDLLA